MIKTTEYIYNHEERLIEVKIDGESKGHYAYNAYGQRIKVTANNETTWFLYNDEGLAAEYDNAGNLVKEYHFKPYSTWMTEPMFMRLPNNKVYYYQNDHLGTPQKMIENNGRVVWEATYEAFGKATVKVEEIENNLRFPGQYYDKGTGLHHNYFRDYNHAFGRYIQADPVGIRGGSNYYIYAYQNSLKWIDFNGLTAVCPPKPPVVGPGSGWVPYGGNPSVFHCGYDGYMEDRVPTPDDPIAECFYDDCGLVDDQHPYAACGGTPNQYRVDEGWYKSVNGWKNAWDHTVNDSGGVREHGISAYEESRRYEKDQRELELKKKGCRATRRGVRCN